MNAILYFAVCLSVYFSRSDPQNQQQLDVAAFCIHQTLRHQTFLRQDPILLTSLPPFCHQSTGLGLLEAQDGSDHDFANNARRHSFVRMYVLLRAR